MGVTWLSLERKVGARTVTVVILTESRHRRRRTTKNDRDEGDHRPLVQRHSLCDECIITSIFVLFLCLRKPTKKKKKKKKLKKWGGLSRPSRPACDGLVTMKTSLRISVENFAIPLPPPPPPHPPSLFFWHTHSTDKIVFHSTRYNALLPSCNSVCDLATTSHQQCTDKSVYESHPSLAGHTGENPWLHNGRHSAHVAVNLTDEVFFLWKMFPREMHFL